MGNPEELIAIVDEEDNILRKARRGEAHEKGLLHREVYVFVVSPNRGRVLLQRRADNDKWAASAGGHFPAEESYMRAAQREFQEELGVSIPQKFLKELCYERFKTIAQESVNYRFAKVFLVQKEIPLRAFHIDSEEVAGLRYFDLHESYSLMKEKKWLANSARWVLKHYLLPYLK